MRFEFRSALFDGDSRFVDFTATPQSGSSVQFVTVVVVLVAKVIMRACVCDEVVR